jgi:hypothetical protein
MHFDVFNNDAFGLSQLSLAMVNRPFVPTRLAQLKLFAEKGVSTLSISLESIGSKIRLVPAKPRGGVPTVVTGEKRTLRQFSPVHLPQQAAITADEVQNLRAFGSETDVQTVQTLVNERLDQMRLNIDVTMEWQRMGAIRGIILDADGVTELDNMFTAFGVTQQVLDMQLDVDATNVKAKATAMARMVESELDGLMYSGIRVLCSPEFFDALVAHPSVEAAYDRYQDGAFLREQQRSMNGGGGFFFAGVFWEEYRGQVGAQRFIPVGEAYAIPEGIPNLFATIFAPANYVESVNTIGLPYYAKQRLNERGTAVEMESQSNPLHVNTRPRAVIRLTI